MKLSARLIILLNFIVAATAIPLPAFEMQVEDDSELSPELKEAQEGVQRQIPKMLSTLDAAQKDEDKDAIKRVKQAFGPDGVSKIDTIRANIKKVDNLKMKVSSKTPEELGATNAKTPFTERYKATDPLHVEPVEFGQNFYHISSSATDDVKTEHKKQNIATVLHEATHYAPDFHASDDYDKNTKKMRPLGLAEEDEDGKKNYDTDDIKKEAGYANKSPVVAMPEKPINEGRFVKSFKDIKKEGDAENNADSYAVFGAACDAAIEHLRKRALMEGDPVAYHLAKRGAAACKLPPNYFAKKAAAAKAAKEKTAGVTSASQKAMKGGKNLAAGKGSAKVLGKAGKSTLQKSSKSGLGKGKTLKGSKSRPPVTKSGLRKGATPKGSKSALKGSKSRLPTTKSGLRKGKTLKGSKSALKGSKSRLPATKSGLRKGATQKGSKLGLSATKSSKTSTRGKLSKAKSPKLGSKTAKLGRSKASMSKGSKALSKPGLTRSGSKKAAKMIGKTAGRQALSKGKGSKALSKASGLSRGKGGKALSKASGLSKAKGGKSLSKASKGLSSKGKTSKARTSVGRVSSKKGGAINRASGRGGKKNPKLSSKLTIPRSGSKTKSSKATSASRTQAGGRSKAVRTKGSPSSQRKPKVPKQMSKALANTLATGALSNPMLLPKKKGGKA